MNRARVPRRHSRDVRVVIENSDEQVIILELTEVVSVRQEPASVFSETLRIMDTGHVVHDHESGSIVGTFCEHIPGGIVGTPRGSRRLVASVAGLLRRLASRRRKTPASRRCASGGERVVIMPGS